MSRDWYRQDRIIPEAGLAKALEDQQHSIYELLQDHKREVDSKLQTKTTKFYKKNIEKQYEVVQDVKLDVKKAIDSARKKDYKKVKKILKNLKLADEYIGRKCDVFTSLITTITVFIMNRSRSFIRLE